MFAKKARALHFSRGYLNRIIGLRRNLAAVRACNDDQQTLLVAPRRGRRPVLLCHWRQTQTGRLECHWASDTADRIDEEISRLTGRARHRTPFVMLAA